jgi:dipeptidyl-peptidase 4
MSMISQGELAGVDGLQHAPAPMSLIAGLIAAFGAMLANAAELSVTSRDYAAAAAMLEGNLQGLVRNESVQPHWIGDSRRFWYRRDGNEGPEFVVVTAAGAKSPAFDHAGLARALSEVLGKQGSGKEALPSSLTHVQLSDDLTHLTGQIDQKSIDCNVKTLHCRAFDTPAPAPELLPSPDGRWAALTRDDNLFVREVTSGHERQLTTDGAPFNSWAKQPDKSFNTVVRQRSGQKTPPYETYWSPDGRYLIAPRVDERKVAGYPFVEGVPTDGSERPIIHNVRLQFMGDRDTVKAEYFLFDLKTGRRSAIELPKEYQGIQFDDLMLDWSRSRGQAFLMASTFASKAIAVFRLDLATCSLSKVLEETSSTRVETNTLADSRPNIRVLGDGTELIWYSDRSGWGHLYLYDAQTGRLKNAITRGDWLVLDIQAVDEVRREIYFTAVGRETGRDPYYRHLYRGSLDGGASVQLLTEPNADHLFKPTRVTNARLHGEPPPAPLIQPAANVFVDTWSTVNQLPTSVLRSTRDGHVIAELEQADASALFATGYKPPVRERVTAADHKTDLYAVYFAPRGPSSGTKSPVIDAAYGGPQVIVTPRNFVEAYRGGERGKIALARLGFAIVSVDGRGTPMRSRVFRDAGYPEFTQVGIDDHIAAIRDLARRHPEMDLKRVGIYGWSWGGTFSAQAILSRPQFYKVAVSGAGLYDYAASFTGDELFIGPPIYADGSRYRSTPAETPANWNKLDVTRLASQLAGHLLIIYADMDENALPNQALRLIDALTRANKPYDLIYLQNRNHFAGATDGYTIKRTWDYLLKYLRGVAPVWDFKVETRPIVPE